jgi:hypothetical protein
MSKKTTTAKPKTNEFVGFVYGGIMKSGHLRFFHTNSTVEDTFNSFKEHYGDDIRGRYAKTVNGKESFDKLVGLETLKDKRNGSHNLFEMVVSNGSSQLKETTGQSKVWTLGRPEKEATAEAGAEAEAETTNDAAPAAAESAPEEAAAETEAPAKKPVAKKAPAKKAPASK